MKKGICFSITKDLEFAVANIIIGIEEYSPGLIDNYIILCDDSEYFEDKSLLKKISPKVLFKNINISDIYLEFLDKQVKRYSKFFLAKFFIFELLQDFEKILWLDADICIQGDISDIFSYGPMAWRPTVIPMSKKLEKYMSLPEEASAPNGGVILVTRDIKDYAKHTANCFNILKYMAQNKIDISSVDEIVFGLLSYKNCIPVKMLPPTYNSGCSWKDSENAKIVHSIGEEKFWNSPLRYVLFPAWQKHHQAWIDLGGCDCKSYKYQKFLGQGSNREILFAITYYEKWTKIINDIGCLFDIYLEPILLRKFIRFFIYNIPKSIHYEIEIKSNSFLIALHFEKDSINEKSVNFSTNFVSQCQDFTLINTPKIIGFEKLVSQKQLIDNFESLIEKTKFSLYRLV